MCSQELLVNTRDIDGAIDFFSKVHEDLEINTITKNCLLIRPFITTEKDQTEIENAIEELKQLALRDADYDEHGFLCYFIFKEIRLILSKSFKNILSLWENERFDRNVF